MQTMERPADQGIAHLEDKMVQRFGLVDARFGLVDKRLDDISSEFRRIDSSFEDVKSDIRQLRASIESMQRNMLYGFMTLVGIMVGFHLV